MKSIARIDLKPVAIVSETSMSATATQLGVHPSTMELWLSEDGKTGQIEWDIPTLEETTQYGLWFDGRKRLKDYDGGFSLPREAIAFLRAQGFTVPRDFE